MTVKKKILIIDDEPDITLLVSSLLEFNDYKVTALCDPTIVLETLKKNKFDLICTDIMMPNIDGFKLIAEILENASLKNIKIIALSAKEFTEKEYKFFLDNHVLLVKKPYDPQTLVTKINEKLKE